MDLVVSDVNYFIGPVCAFIKTVFRADLGKLTMEMENPCGSCLFVEIVDILGDDLYIEIILKVRDGNVGGIRPCIFQLLSPLIVEVKDALGAYSGSCKNSYFLLFLLLIVLFVEVFLHPVFEEWIDDCRDVVAVEGDYFLFHKSVLDPLYIRRGVEGVFPYDL